MSKSRSWAGTIELFVFATLLALGGTTIVSASWARDFAQPRVTLLGADRGVSVLVTAGSARVLIVNGTDPAALGNAISKARHPGLDRLDLLIVSGNAGASSIADRSISILNPRMVMTIGSAASVVQGGTIPTVIIERPTEIELPDGVSVNVELWPSAGGEYDDFTWAATIERGGASVYWVSDREALIQETMPESADVTIVGRGKPASDTTFPNSRVIVVAGESVSGPDLRALALDSLGSDVETVRVFAGEEKRFGLDSEGISTVPDANPAGTPAPV